MAELKNAYEILGLKDGAGKDEIIKRYNILYKKYIYEKNCNSENDISLKDINHAYNELMGYDTCGTDLPEESEPKANKLLEKMNVDEKKLSNFFYYHKLHIIIGVVALVFVIYIIKTVIGYTAPDLKIALVGNFPFQGVNGMESKIYENMKDIKKVEIDTIINWDKNNPSAESAMETKLATLAIHGNLDLYLLDKTNFDKLSDKGILKNLDSLLTSNEEYGLKNQEIKTKSSKEQKEHIYGFDVSSSSIVKDIILPNEKVIFALGNKGKNSEDAKDAIKLLRVLLGIP